MKNKKLLLLVVLLLTFTSNSYAFIHFAEVIIDGGSGTGLDYTGDEHRPRALGEWDKVFLSIGETGYITFGFGNHLITDGVGNDVRVYTTGHSIENEPADILASTDGVNFYSLGMLNSSRTSVWVGDGPSYEIWYQEFDLYDTGLDQALYLKVKDLPGGFVATDIDAVGTLNHRAIPEPATLVLLATGLFGLTVMKINRRHISQK